MNLSDITQAAGTEVAASPLPPGLTTADLRGRAGLTATECAAAIGVSERTWLRYEQGKTQSFRRHDAQQRAVRVVARLVDAEGATA